MQLSEIVDVARYAIDPASGAEYDALVDSARAGLAESGVCVLEGFVRRDAIDRIVASVAPREASAFHKVKQHNVYLVADDPSLGEHHVRNAKETTTSASCIRTRTRCRRSTCCSIRRARRSAGTSTTPLSPSP